MPIAPRGACTPYSSHPPRLRLPPRLYRKRDLTRVFSDGTRIHGRYMTLIALSPPLPTTLQAVIMARKKDFRRATLRNRAKRRLRELLRLHQHLLPSSLWLVLIARPGLDAAPWQALIEDFSTCARRLS